MSKRSKGSFTPEERDIVFDLWKQGAGQPPLSTTCVLKNGGLPTADRKLIGDRLNLFSVVFRNRPQQ
jgi:hypothetical protein